MKNILLLFCLIYIFLFPFNLFSQQNFALEGSVWYNTIPDSITGSPFYDYTRYEYVEETNIDTLNLKYISSTKGDSILVYEQNDKVFYLNNGSLKLLFDFSVKPDDTVYFDMKVLSFLIENETDFIVIDTVIKVFSIISKVDSTETDNMYLKKVEAKIFPEGDILVNATWPSSYIYYQRLGCLEDGMIPLLIKGIGVALENSRYLRCYSDNQINYVNPHWEQYTKDCDYRENSKNKIVSSQNAKSIFIYNSNLQELKISLNSYPEKRNIRIIDASGRIHYNEIILSNNHTIPISLENYRSGLYIIVITNNKGEILENFKFIKK